MRTTVKTFMISLLIGIGFPIMSMATSSFQCTLNWKQISDSDDINIIPDRPSHRVPPRPILLSIDSDGHLSISGVDEEIISYEIWDAYETVCYGIFPTPEEFAAQLFSIPGEKMIVLNLPSSALVGYLYE